MSKPLALIVEDDLYSAKLYGRILEAVGFEFEIVAAREAAFSWLEENVPNLVVLDLRLDHDEPGEDILYKIRADERMKETRVIIVTAYSRMVDEIQEKADLVIIKPINARALKDIVEGMTENFSSD